MSASTVPSREELPAAAAHAPRGKPRASKRSRWRAASLILVHVLVLVHLAHWKVSGTTLSPVEPSEAMQTLELGYVNAGFLLFAVATLATLVLGRFFCGWACHVVAYQDAAAWLLGKVGVRPRPIRSRLLVWVPLAAALYMFAWPTVARWLDGATFQGLTLHFTTEKFWATFPGPGVAALTLLVDGFLVVFLLGAKGFCTYGCPYGAVFGFVERGSRARIRVTSACEGCGHCTATCTSNVLVHLEVARFGQVVDSGCMKCLDCVSVCPKDALYLGFGESRAVALARAKERAPRRTYDFSAAEEAALALVFLATLFAVRGLYDLVPFLLALGLSVLSALAAVLGWRVLRRERVHFQSRVLVERRERSALGWTTLGICAPWFLFLAHSGYVQFHATRGRWLLLDAIALPVESRGPTLAQSLAHLDRAAQLGLVADAELEFQRGQILARQGTWDLARTRLEHALELEPADRLSTLVHRELADLELGRAQALALGELRAAQAERLAGRTASSEAHLLRAVEHAPRLVPALLDLSDLRMSKSPPDLAGARSALHDVLAAEPANVEAQRRLALLEQRFGPEQR
ncbi:MAG TPA: 4Fe-4S binding protein [Planctomycetota bacterium]|nr:4Fe-4S binding protein [Planctomycetota bacterium]